MSITTEYLSVKGKATSRNEVLLSITKSKMGGEGVDIIFEHIGKSVFARAVSLLKMGGTLVSTGATTGYNSNLDLNYLFFRGLNLIGSTQGTKAELEDVLD
jgi:NADPH:quinone reductase-like Zn-dependent oxidoreductase